MADPLDPRNVSEQINPVDGEALTRMDAPAPSAQMFYLALDPGLRKILSPPVLGGDELGWLGNYKIIKVLGRGGMGVVFQAEDSQLQRLVALKVMLPELGEQKSARDRFLREARAVGKLRNDHVVTIYQVGQEQDTPYLAMEFLRGQSLEARLGYGPWFTVAEILRIGGEVAMGLAAAHDAGLIHRDIKPANIWLEKRREARAESRESKNTNDFSLDTGLASLDLFRVKILDFGLARPVQAAGQISQAGNIIGTPHYMSPEQARGQNVDARSDLFSLGIVLYHLCTNQLPFKGDSLMALLTALAVEKPRPIRELNPQVPPALAQLVARLLEKDPAQRPASAQEVVDALTGIENSLSGHTDTGVQRVTAIQPASTTASEARPAPSAGNSFWRRALLIVGLAGAILTPIWLISFFRGGDPVPAPSGPAILIGVLHSQSGTLKISESPIVDAVEMAVEEINQRGGVLGRPVKTIVEDGQSKFPVFAAKAEKLILQDKVVTIFGCWSSENRKAVKEVVEKHDHLLVYPVSYEGMEQSPNIIYGGTVPNQQVLPALKWSHTFKGKNRWYLVGLDSLYSHAINEVIKDEAKTLGGQIVGEDYVLRGTTDISGLIKKIVEAEPNLIVNTISGDINVGFFRALRQRGIFPKDVPTLSFRVSEAELSSLTLDQYAGDYLASNYLEDLERPQNKEFVARFAARYGPRRQISDPMQTAYRNVYLWAQAVAKAGRADVQAIRENFKDQRFEAPQGLVRIDPATLHTIQHARIGKFLATGAIEEVFATSPIDPQPFTASRTRPAWESFLDQLYQGWGKSWGNLRK